VTAFVAALVEAWSEVRIHRVRVIMSLVGVMLAVFAITAITAVGDMARQANEESYERHSGRVTTLRIDVWSETGEVDAAIKQAAFADVVDRYQVEYSTQVSYANDVARFTEGQQSIDLMLVDQAYGDIHRMRMLHGRWFSADDELRFAPALVVNQAFHDRLGAPDLTTHPTVRIGGTDSVTATVIGVVANEWPGAEPHAFLLSNAAQAWRIGSAQWTPSPALELWIPREYVDVVEDAVKRDLQAEFGENATVEVWWNDPRDFELLDSQMRWVIRGISAFALVLGALGLVNIAMVTVRYRIREIGIRRSFGATSARVFFSVMMESVFATMAAGLAGVGLAVVVLKNLPPDMLDVTDLPPFPVSAAVEGMVVATLVGALAGLMPATVAVRSKVIDAIRY
jgi:putative ABC transport system permease protein